jgi:predicted DNA-binding ribbon-helix-helix protein
MLRHSIKIGGHPTSISMEKEFWAALKEIVEEKGTSLSALVTEIDEQRTTRNLSSSLRIFVLGELQNKLNKFEESEE